MSEQTQSPLSPASSTGAAGKVRVLVIDDEPEIRRALRAGLTGAEFAVEWAPTGVRPSTRTLFPLAPRLPRQSVLFSRTQTRRCVCPCVQRFLASLG